jgi:hypothetical protein
MGALVACWDCGFVTRRHGPIGIAGECPHCEGELTPISLAAARGLQIRRHERERARTLPANTLPNVASPPKGNAPRVA